MKYAEIERPADGIALIRLNRPERLNALSPSLVSDAITAFRAVNRERGVRAVVLTGAGRAFCSGADLSGESDPAPDVEGRGQLGLVYRTQEHLVDLILAVHECEKPVIAAVHGAAVGGGLALALAADLRVADPTAKFGSVFIKVGLSSADVGTSYFLPRLVGPTRAAELMLTGRHFSADEADRFGLLNRLTPEGGHVDAALELAAAIAENSEYGVWMTKKGLWSGVDATSLRQQLELENRTQVLGTFTGNMTEAAAAFRERRAPVWKGM
ncbi:enoyl-CoA hydratase/isomerase family protein [Yinghuangia seranimata]|uniref:enoyl-CoA hydratase/isomerase family protein n=1 Tax=Yinghuangia seranimata TaxID=408067 RepID=UPI00248B1BB3|nr:enoyl-CoA hydratase-related protein [Yinghuangia seranimata]MDI2125983.1 enoyl-CoA hydratase-related protein [Yinghuangia seranimata]